MSVSDLDVYRCASIVIEQHKNQALPEVLKKIAKFKQEKNEDAARFWLRIADAVEWMQLPSAINGATEH